MQPKYVLTYCGIAVSNTHPKPRLARVGSISSSTPTNPHACPDPILSIHTATRVIATLACAGARNNKHSLPSLDSPILSIAVSHFSPSLRLTAIVADPLRPCSRSLVTPTVA